MPEALLRDGKAPLVRRASSRVGSGRSSSYGLRPSLEQGGRPTMSAPLASLQLAPMGRVASLRGGFAVRRRPFASSRAAEALNLA